MSQTFGAVFKLTDNYTATMTKIMNSTDSAENKIKKAKKANEEYSNSFKRIKNSAQDAGGGLNTIMNRLTGMITLAYAGRKAFDLMMSALNTSALQKTQETTFQALLKNDKVGSQLYQYVGQYAQKSALGREDIAKGVTSFLSTTRDLNQIERLIKMTERLYAKDPTQGAQGAVFALKEVLAGDVVSMRDRYGITGFSGEKIRNMSAQGDTAGMLDYIDQQLNRFGATQEVVDRNFAGLLTQANVFASNMKTAIGDAATPVMENLAGVMMRLNEMMQAGRFQPFINMMVNGMQMIGNGIAWVVENINVIAPLVVGFTTSILIYKGAMMVAALWTTITGIAVNALAGNLIMAGAILAGVTAGALTLSAAFQDIDASGVKDLNGVNPSELSKGLASAPVEVTNSSAIPVKGEVSIESEDMRYLIDLESQKFFAKFSVAHLAPQINNTFGDIHQTADVSQIEGVIANIITEEIETCADGV
ncbi:hypothetical protein [Acetanaerobacterium elongatum]|uniref:Tape measure domain-containing protein n=1 Tax=Acetanaerobacterium elongatum TaxID=258515 RepID=A0A1G9Z3G1_9FIRM|nr:hypothetical protein [Acetanaerobacterium elongatum]SDN15321.1 hypothetical protein SAMN05192585_11263 [Acetanaerobacterium elongatum]